MPNYLNYQDRYYPLRRLPGRRSVLHVGTLETAEWRYYGVGYSLKAAYTNAFRNYRDHEYGCLHEELLAPAALFGYDFEMHARHVISEEHAVWTLMHMLIGRGVLWCQSIPSVPWTATRMATIAGQSNT